MQNLLKDIEDLRQRLNKLWQLLELESQRTRLAGMRRQMAAENFWQDKQKAIEISQQAEELDKEIKKWDDFRQQLRELEELVALAEEDKQIEDKDLAQELQEKFKKLKKQFDNLEFYVLFSSSYDRNGAIVSIHAGTGGVDAQDWARMLERMILRFCERKGWQTKILDRATGAEAGIKSVIIKVDGQWVYGHLRSENGVHRLVRISPFDAEAMRHTSFALLEVLPQLPEAKIEIKEKDLRIDTYRSSGPGGQSVNTTDSAVRIVHLPTGLTVTCQSERSQHQNKENALRILQAKLFALEQVKKKEKETKLKGGIKKAEWGKQIRSYVLHPYKMVKDHRTNYETSDVEAVLDGRLDEFIEAYLRWERDKKQK